MPAPAACHKKFSEKKWNIVDSFFAPEKIPATFQGNFDNTVSTFKPPPRLRRKIPLPFF
jgi:hypothetical protein